MSASIRAKVAGAIAAGLALATTELVGALASRRRPSALAAVASQLVDAFAGPLRDFAIRTFGTHDKAALLVGIVLVALALGAIVGRSARRRPIVAPLGFALFAVVGFVVGRHDPLVSSTALALGCVAGAVVGATAMLALLRVDDRRGAAATDPAPVAERREPTAEADRRAFLLATGGLGVSAALAATAARIWRTTGRLRPSGDLPAARSVVAVPTDQPFGAQGLTPYVTSADSFYKVDTAIFVPQVDTASWKLTIDGLVERSVSFSYADLLDRDLVDVPVTLACVSNDVGGGLVGNARWLGVPLQSLLDEAGVRPEASQLVGHSVDDFTVGFPTAVLGDGRIALVALGMNGEPLPPAHGYPARLIVAGLYGYVSATKWLRRIELTRLEDYDAYWITRGWAKEGPIKTESRVDVPRSGADVPAGTVTIAGVAWAPTRGISRVEVQVDDGPWVEARLGVVASANTWVQWLYSWSGATPGAHVVAVRATDGTGALQTDEPAPPAPDGASGYHYRGFTVV